MGIALCILAMCLWQNSVFMLLKCIMAPGKERFEL